MKKLILLIFTILLMSGCDERPSKPVDGVNITIIDSCEYISNYTYYGYYVYSHKGNCRFCEERDSIKREKHKKELKELVKQLKEEQL